MRRSCQYWLPGSRRNAVAPCAHRVVYEPRGVTEALVQRFASRSLRQPNLIVSGHLSRAAEDGRAKSIRASEHTRPSPPSPVLRQRRRDSARRRPRTRARPVAAGTKHGAHRPAAASCAVTRSGRPPAPTVLAMWMASVSLEPLTSATDCPLRPDALRLQNNHRSVVLCESRFESCPASHQREPGPIPRGHWLWQRGCGSWTRSADDVSKHTWRRSDAAEPCSASQHRASAGIGLDTATDRRLRRMFNLLTCPVLQVLLGVNQQT